ncbi:hypothetical protein CLV58_1495 [Spirosoma oryzae]|uniref:Uncharacterized protein n=1 Tax=Spirosoma oryzae TaxID=1469603 RepID=A0A2T0RKQ5_9BACT|nr:hypothetical protein [Spirosoma oryzae]PRY21717.1 hypothetical protein CLV58_1495 [Spirosoma oryzae]
MYTAYIGRRLIDLVNTRDGTTRTIQRFFDDVYFPLFFDDERYLQHVNNSKFDQAYKQKGKTPLTSVVRMGVLAAQHQRIQNDEPDGSFFLGGAAAEATAGTSGQVTDIKLPVTPEDVYASWIGAALGIGVSGGLNVLVDADVVLLTLYDGWQHYRNYLKGTSNLKPHQINTWNGWWITNAFGSQFDPKRPLQGRTPDVKIDKASGGASLETQRWINVIFALSRRVSRRLTTYVYSLSQMNTTVGFVLIDLPKVVAVERDLYKQLFGQQGQFKEEALSSLYNTELGFQKACELGVIGLRAIEPASLREYIPNPRGPGKPVKALKDSNDPLFITYTIYQIWIIAMLNNQKLLELSERVAAMLIQVADPTKRGKTGGSNLVNELVSTTNRAQLIERFAKLIERVPDQHQMLNETAGSIALMPVSDIPLFIALLKLKFAVEEAKLTNSTSKN